MKKALSIAVALLVSLFIYLFYRCEKTVVNELALHFISPDVYHTIKHHVSTSVPLSKLVINSLPGGLWVFCVTVLARDLYLNVRGYLIQVSIVPVVFAIGLEFFQLIHLTNGTFDIVDIVSYLLFWLLSHRSFRPDSDQNILSPFTIHGFICVACFFMVFLAHVNR